MFVQWFVMKMVEGCVHQTTDLARAFCTVWNVLSVTLKNWKQHIWQPCS